MEVEIDDNLWNALAERAGKIIEQVMLSMPLELQSEAKRVPCLLERWPPPNEDVLDHYFSFEDHIPSEAPGPMVLYLGAIYEACLESNLDFGEQVRITFLHELGHHLGLDEDNLEERGLL